MKNSIEAYCDDKCLINVDVSTIFYGGKIKDFYLSHNNSIINCKIISTIVSEDKVSYALISDESIEMNQTYILGCEKGYRAPLNYRFIVKNDIFNDFYYDDGKLGSIVSNDKTLFRLFAPTAISVTLKLEYQNKISYHELILGDNGVYEIELNQYLHLALYTYLVNVNNEINEAIDPYGKCSNANGLKSMVVDQSNYEKITLENKIKNYCDAIIYEASVRDFTMDDKVKFENRGKFLGMIQEGVKLNNQPVGFDYLCGLGFSHVQLLPVNDFFTVDELYPDYQYNWGYDPFQYMTLEGSYATKLDDDTRNLEFLQLVNKFHKHGMGVILDVVFNHCYDINLCSFNKVVPYYYFRYKDNQLSNGSYCGNDLDSKSKMFQKYIVDTCMYYVNTFGVDGFRFDLMGIIDIETMNLIYDTLNKINPSIMIYGEGWNMPTLMDDSEKATIQNSAKMPNVAFFNDYFREHIKGSTSDNEYSSRGYASINSEFTLASTYCLSGMADQTKFHIFDYIHQSINYVECHDNATLFDKLMMCCTDESEEEIVKRVMLINAIIMFSQGVPFIHCGQEFCRTKRYYHNTYNLSDKINHVNYTCKNNHMGIIKQLKKCISLRKKCDAFNINNNEEFNARVSFEILDDLVIKYIITNTKFKDKIGDFHIYINPSKATFNYGETKMVKIFDSVRKDHDVIDEIIVDGICLQIYFFEHISSQKIEVLL